MFANYINNLLKTNDEVYDLMKKISDGANFTVKDQDARLVALSGIQEAILSSAFWLHTYYYICEKNNNESSILEYSGSNLSLAKTSDVMITQIKLALVVLTHLKLEIFFGVLLHEITEKKYQDILKTFSELCREIGIKDVVTYTDFIKAFSSMRNALHNNGIHNKESFSIKLDDYTYKFIRDCVTECNSMDHIIKIIRYIILITGEIIETPKIKGMNEIIHDTFADWVKNENLL